MKKDIWKYYLEDRDTGEKKYKVGDTRCIGFLNDDEADEWVESLNSPETGFSHAYYWCVRVFESVN